jgi:hypothetical protein
MRLREPLNGFKFAQGHPIIHIALLFGSMVALNVKFDPDAFEEQLDNETSNDLTSLVNIVRWVHAAILIS